MCVCLFVCLSTPADGAAAVLLHSSCSAAVLLVLLLSSSSSVQQQHQQVLLRSSSKVKAGEWVTTKTLLVLQFLAAFANIWAQYYPSTYASIHAGFFGFVP